MKPSNDRFSTAENILMSSNLYRALKEERSGLRESALEHLTVYRPLIAALKQVYQQPRALDLGCGTGEWLEFLLGEGFSPLGIDADQSMLHVCEIRGVPVLRGDMLVVLASLEDESQTIVSAFHVIEYMTFEQIRVLVVEALRVLKPGGLLIIETPNPENIVMATCGFYADPARLRLVPSELFSFLSEYYGFGRSKAIRFSCEQEFTPNRRFALQNVLDGVSITYAVIAQKEAQGEIMAMFDDAFDRKYGPSLEDLATHYDVIHAAAIEKAEATIKEIGSAVNHMESITSRTRFGLDEVTKSLRDVQLVVRQAIDEARRGTQSSPARGGALLTWVDLQFGQLKKLGLAARVKALLKKLARKGYAYVNARPILRGRVIAVLQRCGLFAPMKSLYFRMRMPQMASGVSTYRTLEPEGLTSCSVKVYRALQAARERRIRGR